MATYTSCSGSFLTDDLDHFPDTSIVEDGIGVHTSEKVDLFQSVGDEELGEIVEKFRREHGQRFFLTAVEVVEHASNED
jgi:hypothetical protein